MRYYDLDLNGRIKGHYSIRQPGTVLYQLDEPTVPFPMRDGVPGDNWITDLIAQAAAQAVDDKETAKAQAIADLLPSWSTIQTYFDDLDIEINAVSNVATAKAVLAKISIVMRKHLRIYYIDVKDSIT
jgi:hypothetical protein